MARRGFRKIDNDTFKALMVARVSGAAFRVVLAIIDKTLGFQREEAEISLSHLQKVTGLSRQSVRLAVKQAENERLIKVQRQSTKPNVYALNGCAEWATSQQNHPSKLGREITPEVGNGITPDRETKSPQTRKPASLETTMPKETIKETPKENVYIDIFNHWNQQNIIAHKQLSDDMRAAIIRTLRSYEAEEIKTAISNYAEILRGEQYFFKYRWTLKDFLKRGIDKFANLEIAKSNFRKEGKGATIRNSRELPKTYTKPPDYADL